MKIKRGLATINIVLIILLCILALGGLVFTIYTLSTNGNKSENKANDYSNYDPDDISEKFMEYILKGDLDNAFKCVYLPDNAICTADDFKTYIMSSKYKEYVGINGEIDDVKGVKLTNTSSETISIEVNESISNIDLNCILVNSEWQVDFDDMTMKNWCFTCPGDAQVFIDGIELSTSCKTGKEKLNDKYEIPAIAYTTKTFKFVTDLGESQETITPTSANNNSDFDIILSDDLRASAYEFVKSTWNDMYSEYIKKSDVSAVKKYFVDNIQINDIDTYYTTSFNNLTKGSSGYKYVDFKLTKIVEREGEKCYVSSNDVVSLNFGYSLNYNWSFNKELDNMNRYGSIRLQRVGNTWKIYEVTDLELFSYSNEFTHDFK